MRSREFSDSIKLEAIKINLENNCGRICCETCGTCLSSIKDCHFDHIHPFAKGGKSTLENCQLLCANCNLKKTDKELQEFILDEKAKQFLNGNILSSSEPTMVASSQNSPNCEMTKTQFDQIIAAFIKEKGTIRKVDFGRAHNKLPPFRYVVLYYGGLNNLKTAYRIEDLSNSWDRETIKKALTTFVVQNGDITQKDMKKANKLPSIPCVLNYYPECKNFTDIKRIICEMKPPIYWTRETAIEYGKLFANKTGKITQKDLRAENNLPSTTLVNNLFGSLANYQAEVGTEVSRRNEFISKDAITLAVDQYFGEKKRVVESQNAFYKTFAYSQSTILHRYGTFAVFCEEHGIKVLIGKKAKYNKREVDDIISKWIKEGNGIPVSHELTKHGLPSRDVILKYYENWKEPFYIYQKLYEELSRH